MIRAAGSPAPAGSLNPLGVLLGVQFESYPASSISTNFSVATQNVYGVAVYATAGSLITGVKVRNLTAAAGSLPTTARFGLADKNGKILVLSANVNALASWPAGVCAMAFTSPFTLTYTGVYFPCLIVNGAWGTTQPSLGLTGSAGAYYNADGSNPPVTIGWAGQTDLPAIGSSLTVASAGRGYWMGLY